MLTHSKVNSLNILTFKRSLNDFVKRVNNREGMVHTGIIQEVVYTGGAGSALTNIIIEITDVEDSPHLSWTDSHFIIQENDVFVVNDPVILLPIRGRFLIIKIEDDFTIRNNRGVSVIASGATSVNVSHGLGITPLVENIHIVLTNAPTNEPGSIWIDTIGSTTFRVHVHNDPGPGDQHFRWKVDAV